MKAIVCLGMFAMLAGCGNSKVELESAKTNLTNVTKERDDLNAQVATLNDQLTIARAALEQEKAAEAQAARGKVGKSDGKGAVASKSSVTGTSPVSKKKIAHKS